MSSAPSPPASSYSNSPCSYSRALDTDTDALLASTLRVLDQRAAPTMHDILAAYTAKGDGDRDMLFALLNAKTAEDNRMAADRNLRRTLLELYRTQPQTSSSAYAVQHHVMPQYPLPSPPTSLYQQSPTVHTQSPVSRRRASSISSRSSDEHLSSPHLRKRRRSRSPNRSDYGDYRSRAYYERAVPSQLDAPHYSTSPYSSQSSSHHSGGSPRSREAMTIGSLLSSRGAEYQEADRQAGSPLSSH
ncbi:uncharacterized protein PHACADRAFT_247019 [Phanerochaete carnosa HHB-10118-sp]|uniref:Uncharacterized protein n=1 Tax=Phanerochaete carnosa (strain HHB-10118-sp) TaxID=650164 RepID=K5WNS7_PHACS|nr:uncharacterized protein PHACADRAFT_247019 [Phanerochaete carnosa HHB-10118-sp]EKM60839.1 hypothetical protein PHACADRAFT_247019 [Phanerochaete carnosa HHB-10118-sp]